MNIFASLSIAAVQPKTTKQCQSRKYHFLHDVARWQISCSTKSYFWSVDRRHELQLAETF